MFSIAEAERRYRDINNCHLLPPRYDFSTLEELIEWRDKISRKDREDRRDLLILYCVLGIIIALIVYAGFRLYLYLVGQAL
jgi:hypothetical protein